MAILRWIFALPIIIAVVAFAIANAQDTTLVWSPIHDNISLPLYAVTLAFLGIGFFLGSVMTWLGMSHVRAERRQYKKEAKRLEKELNKKEEALAKESAKQEKKKDPLLKIIENDKKELESLIP